MHSPMNSVCDKILFILQLFVLYSYFPSTILHFYVIISQVGAVYKCV